MIVGMDEVVDYIKTIELENKKLKEENKELKSLKEVGNMFKLKKENEELKKFKKQAEEETTSYPVMEQMMNQIEELKDEKDKLKKFKYELSKIFHNHFTDEAIKINKDRDCKCDYISHLLGMTSFIFGEFDFVNMEHQFKLYSDEKQIKNIKIFMDKILLTMREQQNDVDRYYKTDKENRRLTEEMDFLSYYKLCQSEDRVDCIDNKICDDSDWKEKDYSDFIARRHIWFNYDGGFEDLPDTQCSFEFLEMRDYLAEYFELEQIKCDGDWFYSFEETYKDKIWRRNGIDHEIEVFRNIQYSNELVYQFVEYTLKPLDLII